ncbi:MAG: hypothetical protein ACPGFA_01275 [Pikeienuella sp.]
MSNAPVTIEDAQSHFPAELAAKIGREFQGSFCRIYSPGTTSFGCGPLQTMLGFAVQNGHIRPTDTIPDPDAVKALVEAARAGLVAAQSDLEWEEASKDTRGVPSRIFRQETIIAEAEARVDLITTALSAFPQEGGE